MHRMASVISQDLLHATVWALVAFVIILMMGCATTTPEREFRIKTDPVEYS